MAEQDLQDIIDTSNGDTTWGADMRGAFETIQLYIVSTQDDLTALTGNAAIQIDWGDSRHFRVDAAGYNITGLTELNAPTSGAIFEGTIEVRNTHGSTSSNVDFTGLAHGLAEVVAVGAGTSEIFRILSTGT